MEESAERARRAIETRRERDARLREQYRSLFTDRIPGYERFARQMDERIRIEMAGSRLYFLGCERHQLLKVGTTRRLHKRILAVQQGYPWPLTLLEVVPGSAAEERALHATLRPHRLRGEWYPRSDSAVAEAIAAWIAVRRAAFPFSPMPGEREWGRHGHRGAKWSERNGSQ